MDNSMLCAVQTPPRMAKTASHTGALSVAALLTETKKIAQPERQRDKSRQLEFPDPIIPAPKPFNETIDYLKLILSAKVYDVAIESPLHYAPKLSAKLGSTIYFKREDLQSIFSFKCRGAFNKIAHLTDTERQAGICCASAGNHAQGVALAAQKLNCKATIVMPKFAPDIKVESVRRMGANVVLFGDDFDEAKQECLRLQKENLYTFIPPFDDPLVIAGQGTVGIEIFKQLRQDRLDAIFICCGGGGLLAGIALYVKRIYPDTKIIGVNTVDSDSMYQSLVSDKVVNIPTAGLFSDGTSVRQIGAENFRVCRSFVDDFVLVTTEEICAAIKDTFEESRTVMEPSGALGVAGMKKFLNLNPALKGGVFVALTSGANMNFDRLRFVSERARLGDGKELLLCVQIPEVPGSFFNLYMKLQPRIVTEFSYRYNDSAKAAVFLALEVLNNDPNDVDTVLELLTTRPDEKSDPELYNVINITDNELVKMHTRFLVGGRSSTVTDEMVFRFRFPERPGALIKFLTLLRKTGDFNVTLWHYRNNGGDFGRVLIGLQVWPKDRPVLYNFLDHMGYPYVEETDNPAYSIFL